MSARTLSSNHSQRADSGGRMSFMPLTARRLSLIGGSALVGSARPSCDGGRAESLLDVVLDQRVELVGDVVAAQGQRLHAVDEDRRRRRLAGARQADADVGMLALAGAVDDAAHDRDLHLLDARIARLPYRHLRAQVVVDLLGELLECRARRPAAARARRDAWVERAQSE